MIAAKQSKHPLFSPTTPPPPPSSASQRNTNPGTDPKTAPIKSSPRSAKKSISVGGVVSAVDKRSSVVVPVTKVTEESKKCTANSAVRNQSQSVPFLQRKFNIFGGGSSSTTLSRSGVGAEKSLRSSGRGSNKSIASTLPRSNAQKATVLSNNNNSNNISKSQTKVTKESKITKREDSENSDTFKGVQSLKQFWNNRIIGSSSNKSSGQATISNGVAKPKIRKGSSASVESEKLSDKCEENKKNKKPTEEQAKPVKTGDEIDNKAVSQVTLRQSSSFAKSDNFNKYKTASSVKLHRVSYNDLGQRNSVARGSTTRQQQTQQNPTKRHTVDSVVCIPSTTKQSAKRTISTSTVSTPEPVTVVAQQPQQQLHNKSTLKFPQIATTAGGAKIHWAKREDILESCGKNKRRSLDANASITMIKETNGGEAKGQSSLSNKLIAKTDTKVNAKQEDQRDKMEEPKVLINNKQDQQSDRDSSDSSQATMTGIQLSKTEGSRSATPSSISLNSNTVSINGGGRTDSPRKINATRRASFKTHSGQGQSIRRLAVGSKVAALTNRFNQLIQTDASIMEEVKRKGVVVHRVNGHVYKIKEEANSGRVSVGASGTGEEGKRKSLSRTPSNGADHSPMGSSTKHQALKRRKSSVKKHDPLKKSSSSSGTVVATATVTAVQATNVNAEKKGVKATIQMFEPTTKNATGVGIARRSGLMKPKVPDKSEHVLRRTKELVSTRRDWEEVPPNRLSLRLDEIKEVTEEKALTPIQEALPPVPTDSKETSPTSTLDGFKSAEKKDKSVYGRIYEKLKINKSSFLYAKKSPVISSMGSPAIQISEPVLNSSTYDLRDPVPLTGGSSSPRMSPEQKIFDALKTVDRKIETLYKSSIELSFSNAEDRTGSAQNLKPNQSFLFRSTSTTIKSPELSTSQQMLEPCAAVNIGLIKSKTTMSMDERNFPFICRAEQSHSMSTSDLMVTVPLDEEGNEAVPPHGQRGDVRTEYQEIINETDKLIRRMNEAYGGPDEEEEDYNDVNEDGGDEEEDTEAVKAVMPESNYDLYEQITSEMEERQKALTKSKAEDVEEEEEESIYQTVAEVKSAIRQAFDRQQPNDEGSVNSYESCDNYEAIDELRRNYREEQKRSTTGAGDGYEICEPPEPPPPRKVSTTSAPDLSNGGPPQLPVPKRNKTATAAKSTFYTPSPKAKEILDPEEEDGELQAQTNNIFHSEHVYEENIYDTIKSSDNTSLLSNNYESISLIGRLTASSESKRAMDKSKSGADSMSYTSNCYESLRGSTLTINHLNGGGGGNPGNKFGKSDYYASSGLRHSESVSTLASDHKTNSIYGTTMHYGGSIATNPGDRNSIAGTSSLNSSDTEVYSKMKHPPSENGTSYSSENSDEWVDISDGEEHAEEGGIGAEGDQMGGKHKLIVVRERAKNRSTTSDWNAKIREQRIHQIQQSNQYYDDDSDHHYESMYAGGAGTNYENQEVHRGPGPAPQTLDIIPFDDDEFDSFDSDLETDDDVKRNDSGVDVSTTRLPDPPSSSNQVYALMQKFKTLSSLSEISKSLSRFAGKKRPKHGNLGDSTSSLYQQGSSSSSSSLLKVKLPKGGKKREPQSNSQFYANTEFHAPRTPTAAPPPTPMTSTPTAMMITSSPLESVSSPVMMGANVTVNSTSSPSFAEYTGVGSQQIPVPLARKKSKSGKSFKSKLRRSLVSGDGNSNLGVFNGSSNGAATTLTTGTTATKSTFYVNDSPDMDSGIFTGSDKTLKMEESGSLATLMNKDASFTDLVNEIKTRNARNSSTSVEDVRRRSIATSRPLSPPPAPPVIMKGDGNGGQGAVKSPRKTSWYDECGVFKADHAKELEKKTLSMTNWYADSGLYQTSGDSVTSSSGSSGVSTGGECNGTDDNSHSMFCNEPLYQIYSAAKLESITRDMELETDGYEEIGKNCPPGMELEEHKKPVRPTALQLVSPKQGPSRTLWSEIPEVINSEILSTLTPTEKRVQEAKFEIITSEASYLKSLNLLKSHFMNHPAFRDVTVLSAADRKTLFSYTIPALDCSEKLLTDLENCWQDNIMLIGLSHSIFKHAESSFKVYVNYCEHQVRLDRILKKLKETNKKFVEILEQLELNPMCCGLSFHSFLMLPMQRITRLPLLIDAVLSKLKPDDDEYDNWRMTLAMLNKIVAQCNEAAHKCEQVYEMHYISRQIEFPSDISPLPIVPMGIPAPNSRRRALVRKGELVHLIWRGDDGKLTFGKKFSKSAVYVFLFTDLLVLTKRKSDDTYLVFDYCCRSMLTVSSGDVIPQLPTKEVAMAGKHLILMTLLENHQGKTVELILSCDSETDRTRWLKATEPPLSENPDETLYEQWDCPQVTTLHSYQGKQPDELSLDVGDVVNVMRKMADGWYHGERIRDGEQGWFPGNYTEEVASAHVRARNLKQRYRLLTFTANYLESQKKK